MPSAYYKTDGCATDSNIAYLIRRSALLLTDQIESAFSARGLSFTKWLALKILDSGKPLSLLELSGYIGFDPGTMSRAVDDLHGEGLVARERSTEDRRAVVLTLTKLGRKFVRSHSQVVIKELNTVLEDFSRAEADSLIGLMQRVLTKLIATQEQRRQAGGARARRRGS